jgi:hypothetical protein
MQRVSAFMNDSKNSDASGSNCLWILMLAAGAMVLNGNAIA